MGSFDQIIRQKQAQFASPRAQDGGMNARDMAAVQMNIANGGPYSTAMPQQRAMPAPQMQTQQPAQQQLPASAPIPTANPLMAAIAAQMGGGGDASTLEQMQNVPRTAQPPAQTQGDAGTAENMQSAVAQAIAAQAGDQGGGPQAAQDAAPQGQTAPVADDTGSGGALVAALASIGGIAGAAQLYKRYQMGDPDAANTFKAIGMQPDDFAMFADDPVSARARGEFPPAPVGGEQNVAAPAPSASKQAVPEASSTKVDTSKVKSNADADMGREGLKIKNLPSSRPKVKPKVKVK